MRCPLSDYRSSDSSIAEELEIARAAEQAAAEEALKAARAAAKRKAQAAKRKAAREQREFCNRLSQPKSIPASTSPAEAHANVVKRTKEEQDKHSARLAAPPTWSGADPQPHEPLRKLAVVNVLGAMRNNKRSDPPQVTNECGKTAG